MMQPKFLFFGYGSEYSLHPLYRFMSEQGDDCVEIDMLIHPDVVESLRSLTNEKLVFVTSAHPLYDQQNFFYYETGRKVISALHVISTLEPVASVYYPHDLLDCIKPEEIHYLPLFDLFLSPFEKLKSLDAYVPVQTVGWIKHTPKETRIMPEDFNPSRCVFFPGVYQKDLNLGLDVFYDKYKVLFDAGVAVKLHRWHDNDLFEGFLRERNVGVYSSEANSVHVMEENNIILTHALSSVGVEACALGKSVIYIKNKHLDYRDPETEMRGAGNINYVDTPKTAVAALSAELSTNERTLRTFDFAGARDAIWNTYKNKAL